MVPTYRAVYSRNYTGDVVKRTHRARTSGHSAGTWSQGSQDADLGGDGAAKVLEPWRVGGGGSDTRGEGKRSGVGTRIGGGSCVGRSEAAPHRGRGQKRREGAFGLRNAEFIIDAGSKQGAGPEAARGGRHRGLVQSLVRIIMCMCIHQAPETRDSCAQSRWERIARRPRLGIHSGATWGRPP